MVIPTVISISCCCRHTERKTSEPWPENAAYASVAAHDVDRLAAADADALLAAAGHVGPIRRYHIWRKAMRPVPGHVVSGSVTDLVRSGERRRDRPRSGHVSAIIIAIAGPEIAADAPIAMAEPVQSIERMRPPDRGSRLRRCCDTSAARLRKSLPWSQTPARSRRR